MLSGEMREAECEGELRPRTSAGCGSACGMCPACVFAPKPPGSTQTAWRVWDQFKRGFVLSLLLRCGSVRLLDGVRSLLEVASWTPLTYARSRSPTSPVDFPARGSHRALEGKPHGVDVAGIWRWFKASPDWIKSGYLCRVFALCDAELLRMASNLTSVLMVRQKRGFLQSNVSLNNRNQDDLDSDDPELTVVPGSFRSLSGVGRYRDFVGCLPVHLAKRILGLLDENTLGMCKKVCGYWQQLAQETTEEMKFRRVFQDQINAMMKRCHRRVNPTYANMVGVPVPRGDDDTEDVPPADNRQVLPFGAAYADIKTKTVQMEERNVYCGAYFTRVLLAKEDPHRVLDYRGGALMAAGSKDRLLQLLHVASEVRHAAAMKGHLGSIRAALLCEDRGLVITGSADASIRCWSLKTDRCEMMLYGHTGTVTCLDVHADRLVSGAKDCLVKVWSLSTGKQVPGLNLKHPSAVLCARINKTTVYSSCDRGLLKVWSLESGSPLRVIDAHRSPVRCLHVDQWHLLSGDSGGKVKAWSVSCDATECLMTFSHPKEVKSLALVYLRVVTGCADGKIRIFNFLTGDCLKDITAEAETGSLLSAHFHDNSIVVNAVSGVKLYQFAKVFWEYADSSEGGQGDDAEKSAASIRKLLFTGETKQANRRSGDGISTKTDRGELLEQTQRLSASTKGHAQARLRLDAAEASVMLSERAATQRMKRRGLHHPPTRDCIVLRINMIQQAQREDDVSVNTEINARLRDSWGPRTPEEPRAKTCVPILKRSATRTSQSYALKPTKSAGGVNKGGAALVGSPSDPGGLRFCTILPRIDSERRGARPLAASPLKERVHAKRAFTQNCPRGETLTLRRSAKGQE